MGDLSEDRSLRELRGVLERGFPMPSDFDAFVFDHFPDVYRRYSSGMDRTERVTLLLAMHGAQVIAEKLRDRASNGAPSRPHTMSSGHRSLGPSALRSGSSRHLMWRWGILGLFGLAGILALDLRRRLHAQAPTAEDIWNLSGEIQGLPGDRAAQVRVGTCLSATVQGAGLFALQVSRFCAQGAYEVVVTVEGCTEQRERFSSHKDFLRIRWTATCNVVTKLDGHVYLKQGDRRTALQGVEVALQDCPRASSLKPSVTDVRGAFELNEIPSDCRQPPYRLHYEYQKNARTWESPRSYGIEIDVIPTVPVGEETRPTELNRGTDDPGLRDRGEELLALGRLDDAEKVFDKAMHVWPQSPEPVYGKARVAHERENYLVAETLARKALQLSQDHEPSRQLLIESLLLSGDLERIKQGRQMIREMSLIPGGGPVWLTCLNEFEGLTGGILSRSELDRRCPLPGAKSK